MVYRKKGAVGEESARSLLLLENKAATHGGFLLSTNFSKMTDSFEFECQLGHKFALTGSSVLYKNSWCSKCRLGMPSTNDEVNAALALEGLSMVSPFENLSAKSQFKCGNCGNTFVSPLNKVLNGIRTCTCKSHERRLEGFQKNYELLEGVAKSQGGLLLSEEPAQMKQKFRFRCSQGHEWEAQGTSVLRQGTWCPKCAGNSLRSLEELRQIVTARGGELLSEVYEGVDATYEFKCNLGHEFANMFKKVEGGQWCPTCNRGTKSEEITRTYFEELFGVPFRKARPKWLRNSRGRQMELDGYSPELQIAFEYQGIQHFKDFGLYKSDLNQRITDDELKFQLCQERGINLFYLTYKDSYDNFAKLIQAQAEAFHLGFPEETFKRQVDLSKAYLRDDRLEELRGLLAPKQIKVLSNVWLTSDSKYDLECNVCGNVWQARGNAFFNRRSVAGCGKCARKKSGEAQRGSLKDLEQFAAKFGGEVLSGEYVKRRHDYLWRCSKGHEFERNFNNMAFRQQFCPTCEGTAVRNSRRKG